jgi:hypothetical protein
MFFVSNLPSSSQGGRQSTYEELDRIGNDKTRWGPATKPQARVVGNRHLVAIVIVWH